MFRGNKKASESAQRKVDSDLRILFISPLALGMQGTTTIFMIPTILRRKGHDVHVISAPRKSKIEHKAAVSKKFEFQTTNIDPHVPFFRRIRIVGQVIAQYQPQIVHVFFGRWAFLYALYYRLSYSNSAKWVLDIRSPLLSKGIKRFLGTVVGPIEQMPFDAVCGPAESSISDVLTWIIKPNYIVPLGVDTKLFQARCLSYEVHNVSAKKFIYIGSLSKKRQLICLLEGILIAVQKVGETAFSVDMIGHGDGENNLRNWIEEHNLSTVVRLKETLLQHDLAERLLNYDCGLAYIPRIQYGRSPALKTLEYMATGLFVIASDTEGNRVYIRHGENGVLTDNTPHAIGDVIVTAVTRGFPVRMRSSAVDEAKKWDWDVVVNKNLMSMYLELLRSTRHNKD